MATGALAQQRTDDASRVLDNQSMPEPSPDKSAGHIQPAAVRRWRARWRSWPAPRAAFDAPSRCNSPPMALMWWRWT